MHISKVTGQEKIYQSGPQIYCRLPITSTIDDSIVQIVRPDVKDVLHELLLIVPGIHPPQMFGIVYFTLSASGIYC